jgi:hypothetical protein
MNRNDLIAYFARALRESPSPDTDENALALRAATLADAFLSNRVERPAKDSGDEAR